MHNSRPIPIDTLDNLDRLTYQAQAVVKCLLAANENCTHLSPRLIEDSLWLVMDRLNDIGSQLATPANQLPAEQEEELTCPSGRESGVSMATTPASPVSN